MNQRAQELHLGLPSAVNGGNSSPLERGSLALAGSSLGVGNRLRSDGPYGFA
jgi:hypothetical protein